MATMLFAHFDCYSRIVSSHKTSSGYAHDSLSYKGKELPLGFNTAVVTPSGPRLHSKSDSHGVSHVVKRRISK